MIELTRCVEQAQEQRGDLSLVGTVAESANDTVRSAGAFHLHHGAFTASIGFVQALGDDPVHGACAGLIKPVVCLRK